MGFDIEFELSPGEFSAALREVRRFERMRLYPAIVLITMIGLASLPLDTKVPVAVAAMAIVVLALLGFRWLRVVRLAAAWAPRLGGKTRIRVGADGIALTTGSVAETLCWPQVLHCTRTRDAWLFIGAGGRTAFVLPRYALTEGQTAELTGFLATWSKHRYRLVPVRGGEGHVLGCGVRLIFTEE